LRQYVGHYQKAEAPLDPLQYQFLDADGVALDLGDFSAVTFAYTTPSGTTTAGGTATITVSATGDVAVDWTAAHTSEAGTWEGIFWLTPGPVPSHTLVWVVSDGPGPT
jgi:hypothetical protein